MKKLLTLLLTLLMVFTLVGCNSKEDTPIVNEPEQQEEVVEPINEDEPIVGGFVDAEDKTITDELKDIFNKALDGLTGAKYEPVELVATQVVAGTNYKFLANGTKTTNPITKGTYYITIYKDLQGNVELLDIETIEEKQEETKTETKKEIDSEVLKTYKYWVVFYDQYGNELQREALKYGTVPKYKMWLPEGFDKWIYKKTGKDVGSFKSITGNTYYQAVCHEVKHGGGSSSSPTPGPTPACSNTDDMYYFTYASYDGWASWQTNFTLYRYNGSGFNYGIDKSFVTLGGPSSNIATGVWYHSSDQNTFVECTDPSHHEPYGHVCPNSSTYLLHVYDSTCNADVYQWNPTNSEYEFVDNRVIDWAEFNPYIWSDTWVHTNDVDHPGLGSQTECIDYDAHVVTCFVVGTQVQYDLLGHTKNIEDFKVGDQIVSYNVNTNKYYLAKVGRVFIHDGYERVSTLADVMLEDGSVITMTPNHPVLTKDGFRAINNKNRPELQEGQFVRTGNEWTKIKEIRIYNCEPTVTYNLGIIDYDEVVDDDTYDTYIAGGIVVHNLY